jgi:uncharacterized phiE125 gp8 family phage protein
MGYVVTVPPASEPVSRAEAKVHLRVDTSFTDDDLLIDALITAARQFAEQETDRSFITQTWKYTMDCLPGSHGYPAPSWGDEFTIPGNAIVLTKGPIQSISSITYLDTGGVTQTMPSTDYIADLSGPAARITPVFGKIWPIAQFQIASAAVTFVAGYGGAAAVPNGIKQWMLLRIGAMYENREEIVVGRGITANPLSIADSLLDPYRVRVA